jgi:hypothetical protein
MHRVAAAIRETRAEYTSAVYDYLAADQLAAALWTWYPHRSYPVQMLRIAAALYAIVQG